MYSRFFKHIPLFSTFTSYHLSVQEEKKRDSIYRVITGFFQTVGEQISEWSSNETNNTISVL